ncbi:hypothetical protein AVEN_20970-1, partial [Araneus ventricosus]
VEEALCGHPAGRVHERGLGPMPGAERVQRGQLGRQEAQRLLLEVHLVPEGGHLPEQLQDAPVLLHHLGRQEGRHPSGHGQRGHLAGVDGSHQGHPLAAQPGRPAREE